MKRLIFWTAALCVMGVLVCFLLPIRNPIRELTQDKIVSAEKVLAEIDREKGGYYPSGYTKVELPPDELNKVCLLYTSPSPRDGLLSRMPSSA